jgi:CO dehydrogenase maturation factor
MRIAFLGKGGSGKTSIAAGYARWLEQKRPVLAIDADVNMHLQTALNLKGEAPLVSTFYDAIAEYVLGDRKDLRGRPLISTTPSSPQSRLITCSPADPLLSKISLARPPLTFLKVGAFSESDVGANCYHTKLHSLCVILNHLSDNSNDRVVVDATAGVDTLSTSLVASYDLNAFVVEPTLKSVSVFDDFLRTDPESAEHTCVVVNKVSCPEDYAFVRSKIPESFLIAQFPLEPRLRLFEQGDSKAFLDFIGSNEVNWQRIESALSSRKSSFENRQKRLFAIHKKNCDWWYNSYYGQELQTGLDGFSD